MLKNIKAGDTTCLKTSTRASIDILGMYNYSFIQVGLLFVAMVVIIQCTAAPYAGFQNHPDFGGLRCTMHLLRAIYRGLKQDITSPKPTHPPGNILRGLE